MARKQDSITRELESSMSTTSDSTYAQYEGDSPVSANMYVTDHSFLEEYSDSEIDYLISELTKIKNNK